MWWYIGLLVLVLVLAYFWLMSERPVSGAFRFEGGRAIVTGGSSGIGLATAIQLVKRGCHVAIIARDPKKLDQALEILKRERRSDSVHVFRFAADISNSSSIQAASQQAISQLGGVDLLVANAGASHAQMFLETSEADFRRMMDVNYFGTIYSIKAVVNTMVQNGGGRIVIVGSMAGLTGVAGLSAYGAAKFALRGVAEAMAMELAVHRIGVTMVCPPDVDTPMLAEENIRKPEECKRISEGSGLFTAEQIAADIMSALYQWRFLVTTGFDGKLLGILATGTSPAHSMLYSLLESTTIGWVRAISLVYRWSYNRICFDVHQKRLNKPKAN